MFPLALEIRRLLKSKRHHTLLIYIDQRKNVIIWIGWEGVNAVAVIPIDASNCPGKPGTASSDGAA